MSNLFFSLTMSSICFYVQLPSEELSKLYQQFLSNYPIVTIEDPFDQDDWEAYTKFTAAVSQQVVGCVQLPF